ncbi:universal stress protein [Kitasatospora sp. NPDC050463]|uniref:universal stress protein n=1 Tax=Kitasatospora sp. NPDC050463 TaxID=3155786 RepID=UPI0033DC4D94
MTTDILAAIDGSPESTAAALWAADEAASRGLALRLVHAQTWLDDIHADPGQPEDVRALTARMLAETAEQVQRQHPGLEVRTELLSGGDPVDLLAAADAELLVLGSRGLGGFTGLLVGSVGLAVTARSDCPTVLVRAAQPVATPDAREVVVGVDTREPSDTVLDFAFRQAALRGTPLRAVHGWTPPSVWGYAGWVSPQIESTQFQALEAELLHAAVAGWREKFPEVEVIEDSRVDTGSGAVVDASADAALVVVGRRRRPLPLSARLGPVAHAVVHHAHAPVAVVPHD